MLWQDITITIVSVVFSIALLPQVYHGFKNKKGHITHATSVPTFVGLYVLCVVYLSLGLLLSTVVSFLTATMWLVLCVQRWLYGDPVKEPLEK